MQLNYETQVLLLKVELLVCQFFNVMIVWMLLLVCNEPCDHLYHLEWFKGKQPLNLFPIWDEKKILDLPPLPRN